MCYIAEGQEHKPESQIYNWGIKKDASLDGAQPAKNDSSRDISSDASNNNISKSQEKVNKDYIAKEASSQEENASFFDDYNSEKRVPQINPDEVIEGFWEDSPNKSKNIVEKSQLESVENVDGNGIIRKAKEYLLSHEGQNDTRPYLKYRPSYSKNQVETVFENSKDEFGKVYDPTGMEIQ